MEEARMRWSVWFALVTLAACSSSWTPKDGDGDGASILDGDCNDLDAAIGPSAEEVWYDGVDQDCDGNDGDKDGDGHLAVDVGGDDCWDDPDGLPKAYTALNGLSQPAAAEVYPGADDAWYDGVDQDCAGDDDFDQDGDGYASAAWADADGVTGDDCYDSTDDAYPDQTSACPGTGVTFTPAEVHPGAEDAWYDGTDQDCDGVDDFDKDGDAFPRCEECDDDNAGIYPNDAPEVWYNGVDENCDGNDGDQDGDFYVVAGYPYEMPPDRLPGDCWDDPTATPTDYTAVNGFPQPNADEVYPEAPDEWYDAVDADCAGDDDFDRDGDGYETTVYRDRGGQYGDDCDDDDGAVHPGASETWYDGTDQDCDAWSDYDQDRDGHEHDGYGGDDCDDKRATVNPDENEDCATTYDDDCDTDTNDEGADGCETFHYDGDDDGYGTTTTACYCVATGHYDQSTSTDCNDADKTVNPAATEGTGDNVDQNCDGKETCYTDADNDGHSRTDKATASSTDADCNDTGESVSTDPQDDCNDASATVYTGATEVVGDEIDQSCDGKETCYSDADNDDYASESGATTTSADADCDDSGEAASSAPRTDCDDGAGTVHPGATEVVGDEVDQDCDDKETCYADADNDDYADETSKTKSSTDTDCADSGEASDDLPRTDCNDGSSSVNPGKAEVVGDNVDENCDDKETCYADADKDGFGDDGGSTVSSSDADCKDSGEAEATDPLTDCDDSLATVKPGATEVVADGVDQDCDGGDTCYVDSDGDDYGTSSTVDSADLVCTGTGEAVVAGDCNDGASSVNPGKVEVVADNVDQNCDNKETCYVDADKDGYGDDTLKTLTSADADCKDSGEAEATDPLTDCNDASATVKPGATETVGNGVDEDCDGGDTCYRDLDGDGFGTTTKVTSVDLSCADAGESTVSTDCDDTVSADPLLDGAVVYPGADELCDLRQNECGSTWAGDDGLVSFLSASTATWTDATSTFTSGTSTSPKSISVAAEGDYYVCSGTYYVAITTSGFAFTMTGLDSGGGMPTLSKNGKAGSTLAITGVDATLADLHLVAGQGSKSGSDYYGGALWISDSAGTSTVTLDGCDVEDGGATATYGGLLALRTKAQVDLVDTTLTGGAATDGGAVWIEQGDLTCDGAAFDANTASGAGGAVYLSGSGSSFTATACTFSGNTPHDVQGAGSFADYDWASGDFSCDYDVGCAP